MDFNYQGGYSAGSANPVSRKVSFNNNGYSGGAEYDDDSPTNAAIIFLNSVFGSYPRNTSETRDSNIERNDSWKRTTR